MIENQLQESIFKRDFNTFTSRNCMSSFRPRRLSHNINEKSNRYLNNNSNRDCLSTFNNENSKSMPLKVMLTSSLYNDKVSSNSTDSKPLTRSWTDNSFFYQNDIDCYLYKYSQLSRSEQFLGLLEQSAKYQVITLIGYII